MALKTNRDAEANGPPVEAGKFRTILPQVLACTVKNFLLLDLGLSLAIPTIVIPALTGNSSILNPNEIILVTAAQASWLGSIMFIFEPLGSFLSGWVTEPIGRKRAMFFVNVPHVIAWAMLYYSTTLTEILVAFVFLGLGVGLMEAPIMTYVGEICQASIRGVLVGMSGIAATFGLFLVWLLGSITDWRSVALYCMAVPISAMVFVCFIPETPLWLLSKDRTSDAQKSLQWLRGWVSPQAVDKEFNELKHHSAFSKACNSCSKTKEKCVHPPPTTVERMRELIRRPTLMPFVIVSLGYTFCHFSGFTAMRPFIVLIFRVYGIPIDPNWATVWIGAFGVIGTIICVSAVKFVGKRGLYLSALSTVLITNIALSIYGYTHLPAGTTSFSPPQATNQGSIFPLVMVILMGFATAVGVTSVPPMLLSELFPFKTRGVATGITGAFNFLLQFITSKTYLSLESFFSLPGVSLFYAVICVVGLVVGYLIFPETEKRSLEDIELHFAKENRSFFDRRISISNNMGRNSMVNGTDHKHVSIVTFSNIEINGKASGLNT